MEEYTLKDKLKMGMALGLFFVFTVFLYGPLGIYLSNADELKFGLGVVIKDAAVISVIAFAGIVLFSLIVPKILFKWYSLLVLGVGLGFYIQGNYINYDYGVLDGTEIRWSDYTKYGLLNTLIWCVAVLLPFIVNFIVSRKDKKLMNKIIVGASLFLVAIQIPALISQVAGYKKKGEASLIINNDNMFEMASDENIIVFVLDTLDEVYYKSYIKEHPEFEEDLPGFVHYDNALTGGARTMMGMPIMFTGKPYNRQGTYSDYIDEIYSEENVLQKMSDAGYDVRVYSESLFYSDKTADWVSNYEMVTNPVTSDVILTKKLYKLSLFKFMPHFLKARFWMQTSEFEEAMKRDNTYQFDDSLFYEKFKQDGLTTSKSVKKSFTVYHMRGVHRPFNMDENAVFVGHTGRKNQLVGTFKIVKEYIDKLKEQGLYDSSTIMITADHGDKKQCQRIMLMLKEAGATGEVTKSHAPVSSFDFPIYFTGLIGETLPDQEYGVDFKSLKDDDTRRRYVYRNTADNSKLVVKKFYTDAEAKKTKALKLEEEFVDNNGNVPYVLGTRLGFDADSTGNSYVTEGFGNNHGFRTKMRGPYGRLEIPFEEIPDDTITAKIELYNECEMGYDVIIKANGKELYNKTVDESVVRSGISFDIDPSCFNEDMLVLEFEFPHISQEEMNIDVLDRTITLSVVSLTFDEK
ncbi:MAG: sulfatase-like hydrolase/transferase [Eubacterium sp.]|nr:sulfatase-like hydrolase/transferase [Eubacterium sp.]